MKLVNDIKLKAKTRRHLFASFIGLALLGLLGTPFIASAADPIKVGILQPFSGGLEVMGNQGANGAELAFKEANEAGGVLGGRMFEIIRADTKTDPKTAVEKTNELIRRHKVTAIIGPVTSANRDAIQPTLERYKTPLLYATDYEGDVCSRYIIGYSALPDHWVKPLIPYVLENYGKKFFLFGSDYVWPQKMNKSISDVAKANGGTIVAEEYSPWGVKDYTATLRKISNSGADVVVLTVVGADAVTFVKQFTAAGMKDKIRIVFFGFSENYIAGLTPAESNGIVTASNFTSSLDKPESKAFVKKVRMALGEDAIVSNTVDAHYTLAKFFIAAIKRAGSPDKEKIIDSIGDQTMMSGNGEVHLRASDRHTDLNVVIAETIDGKLIVKKDIGRVVAANQCK
ncbi:MAG: substrate-binding protein [SAR324 cluster bacterium]|nr:substrate-binding protein [SAR324 cluster bacterium]